MARLKIATYNINGVRARLGALLEWLERESPDIACLQELKAPDEAFPQLDVERLGYGVISHGQKSWNGVAILARGTQPEERRRSLPGDPDATQSRYLEADVHGLRVGCLYLPNGNPWPGPKFDYKLAWFAALQKHAARLLRDGVPTVLCGDFNVVPTDEFDIYNPASWRKDALLQSESREAWFALLDQGWTDCIRAVHGDARIYTFWDYFRKHWERDAGLRIDHLLLSPELAPALRDAGVDRWVRGQKGASDHAPTWIVLDSDGGGRAQGKSGGARAKAASAKEGVAAAERSGRVATKPAASGRLQPAKRSTDTVKEFAAGSSMRPRAPESARAGSGDAARSPAKKAGAGVRRVATSTSTSTAAAAAAAAAAGAGAGKRGAKSGSKKLPATRKAR